ncbi:hypothetical protein [Caloramator sp. Dgby_cultured_2]|uniref:hypothetical protein n=1 Tax=Caloramator sp. Dgby_cultured_2 TaxID=3029174 RepID=UPI00237D4F3C|nr:hypothetical protein [Caloramator sp. Dgby_cultured_2]WDU83232.1 hypothetical protein PWK10_00220 [Caloramator sp. Dgby_cultured_2]
MNIKEFILNKEMLGSFKYFWKEANIDKNSKGYGLIRDRAPSNPNVASIAAVGFGLTAIPIGIKEDGYPLKKDMKGLTAPLILYLI